MGCWYNPCWIIGILEKPQDEESSARMHEVVLRDKKNNDDNGSNSNGSETNSLEEALVSLGEGMLPKPSIENLAYILCMCTKERNLAFALRLHCYIYKSAVEAHRSLGNYLVAMLVEVGSMCNAQKVFDRLVYRTESSWNSLITGHIKCGKFRHALLLYQKMQEDSLHPSGHTFVALLKACTELKDLEVGYKIHVEIAKNGFLESDLFVGNTLVDMYAKCGSLAKAQEVFDKLQLRDVVSWNTLIAGYAKHEHGKEALNCFKQMQLERVSPNAITFVCSLKACGSMGATGKGREIHAQIARNGLLERNLVVGNALVDMYAKCGCLAKAQEMFDKLPVRDIISWNALMAGYAKYDHGREALNYFGRMQVEGVSPNAVTFVSILKACGSIGAIDKGREIHAEIARKGLLERDLVVGNALVDMYAKCGLLAKAQEVFDKLLVRDVVSWTALIAGYAKYELGEEALNCFRQMQWEGLSPNAATFVCSLRACSSIGAANEGREIHAEIARKGFLERDLFVGNALVDMYAKCGLLAKAQEVFDKLPVRDVILWTALIAGYAKHECCEEALMCFEQMQIEGVSPNAVTYVCSLKACGSIGATNKGREIHAEIARKGSLEKDLVVGNALVDMYAKCGWLAKAQEVFDKLPVRDVVSWTALIAGYAKHERGEEALNCFKQMQLERVSPNSVTLICSLKACCTIGATDTGRELHADIARKGLLERDLVVGNALVDMYAKCGSLAKAQEVFDKLPFRDVISWNALIAGYAQLGESKNVFHVFERMRAEGERPDLVTFVSVLNACSQAGLVDKGQVYFEAMRKDYGISPTLEHHTCMVDLLSRAGHLDMAIGMIKKMPLHPDLVLWQTLLDACLKWGNVELGRKAYEHVVGLDDKDASAYVCMCNIYADTNMLKDVDSVTLLRA